MKNHVMRLFPVVLGLFALTLGLFLPTSCTKENFDDFQDEELVEMIITVGGNTKTSNDGDSTLWSENDELSVIHSAPNATTFWLSPFTYYPSYGYNAFYGTVSKLSANNDWYAVYPYNASHTSAESVSLTFPASQTQTGNGTAHLAGADFPMVGKATNVARSTDLSIRMENLLAVAEFKVKNTISKAIMVEQIEFTASSPIAGAFSVNLTGDAPVLTAGAAATKTVKLDVAEGEQIAADGDGMFYMGVAPFQASAGTTLKFKILAKDADGNTIPFYYSLTLKNDATFTSNEFQTIQLDFDDQHQTNPDAGSAGEVELPVGGEPEDGVYLLVYENGANSMAFAPFDEYKSQNFAIPVVVTDGVVLPQDGIDLARFAVELENTHTEHPNDAGHDAYNVRNSEGKYVFYATAGGTYEGTDAFHIMDSNEMDVQGTTYQYYHTFTQTTDGVRIVCSINTGGNFYLLSYTSANGFNYQQDSAAGTNLHLYLLGAKEKQELTFEPSSITYNIDIDKVFSKPKLSGASTSVRYSSSDVNIAEVDPTTGDVTIKNNLGTATITAIAEANDDYYSGKAEYTITVTENPRTPQDLSFEESSVTWILGEILEENVLELNGIYDFPQEVQNAKTSPVFYESSKASVAEIIGNKIKIIGTGQTTITAKAPRDNNYSAGEASYTLRIREQVAGDFVDLGTFNLENEDVYKYLNAAETQYTDDNYKRIGNTNGVSIVSTYTDGASNTNRKDIPKPVTIDWGKSSSGTTTITIFSDPDLAETVWTQSTTTSKTSDVVYNLIPGETYYCTVEDQTGLLLQGTFTTEGRRRMIRLSGSEGAFDKANNFRDLGGLVTADGKKRIKYGWIFRGTNLDSTTADERAIMLNYLNIGYDIDLRQSNEGKRVFNLSDANYLMADYGANLSDLRTKSKVKATMQAFFDAAKAGKASYFHCRIGSDRTGYWGLLIEGMLGISAKDCSIDFELTGFAKNVTSGDRPRNATNYLFYQGMEGSSSSSWGGGSSQPGFMQVDNDGVPKFEGSTLQEKITNYLVNQVGIDRADIEEFKSLVLEDI